MAHSFLIFIPTFNERENVELILAKLLDLKLNADILFVDDNSPDGTGEILDDLAKKYSNVLVKHREKKSGIGGAHSFAIQWAYKNRYDQIITMDCDFSHSPEYIPLFIEGALDSDIVVGSRFMRPDSLRGWSIWRKLINGLGHILTTIFLKLPYDATGAYRLYNLRNINLDFLMIVESKGYSFFFESLFVLNVNGYKISEVSIDLPARTYGHSKMVLKDMLNSLRLLNHIFWMKIFNPSKFKIRSKK